MPDHSKLHLFHNFLKKKDKQIILNKDLEDALQHKQDEIKRKKVEVQGCQRFLYINFYCAKPNKNDKQSNRMIYELILEAERIIEEKSEIFNYWKLSDQFRLMKKIMINKS